MSRVLILGMSPLPFENEKRLYGPGIRTWQFAKPLLDEGHDICLVCARIPYSYGEGKKPLERRDEGFAYYDMEQYLFNKSSLIQEIHDDFKPDFIVGATVYPSSRASLIKTKKPLWGDLFGHFMAEAQAKAYVYGTDLYLSGYWDLEQKVLDRADIISVVSERQKYATIGELGTRGRLNKDSLFYDFVHVIPCAMEAEEFSCKKGFIRKSEGKKDFSMLWSGGYNTWTDVDTLFYALENAMRKNRNIRFVSIGGAIDGHDERTYPHFLDLIEDSSFRDRFVMEGWVPTEDVPNYYFESDLGINIDKNIYEVVLGSKNRILDWLRAGLPVLTSRVCELSLTLEEKDLAVTFEAGDAEDLEKKILWCASHRKELKAMGMRAKKYAFQNFSYEKTTEPLREWAKNPREAPDRDRTFHFYSKFAKGYDLFGHYVHLIRNEGIVRGSLKSLKWAGSKVREYF